MSIQAKLINTVPSGHIQDADGMTKPSWATWFSQLYMIAFASQQSGATVNRPVIGVWVGRVYFDTDLGIPVWVKSVAAGVATWVDASGAPV